MSDTSNHINVNHQSNNINVLVEMLQQTYKWILKK